MTIRRNAITGIPILFAPERAVRPHAFAGDDADDRCPFCPGHEQDTPPSVVSIGDPWSIRVFPNKYPPAHGAEVVVEAARHDATFDTIDDAAAVVSTWIERASAHPDAAYVAIFKNEGRAAGSSIPHVHSQVIPLPFVPPRAVMEGAAFARSPRCALCEPVEGSTIDADARWTWLTPYASAMPYQQWLVPRRHVSRAEELDAAEIESLAGMLRRASAAMLRIAGAYNWTFSDFRHEPHGHFYVELYPRLATIAGLELGTGTFVEIIDPAAAAVRLRG
jgi:UDPglucose--hexose-1-phosphate uridylyltransferase